MTAPPVGRFGPSRVGAESLGNAIGAWRSGAVATEAGKDGIALPPLTRTCSRIMAAPACRTGVTGNRTTAVGFAMTGTRGAGTVWLCRAATDGSACPEGFADPARRAPVSRPSLRGGTGVSPARRAIGDGTSTDEDPGFSRRSGSSRVMTGGEAGRTSPTPLARDGRGGEASLMAPMTCLTAPLAGARFTVPAGAGDRRGIARCGNWGGSRGGCAARSTLEGGTGSFGVAAAVASDGAGSAGAGERTVAGSGRGELVICGCTRVGCVCPGFGRVAAISWRRRMPAVVLPSARSSRARSCPIAATPAETPLSRASVMPIV